MMIARPWEKDNYPIQDALCSYNHSIFLRSLSPQNLLGLTKILPRFDPELTPLDWLELPFCGSRPILTVILALPGHNFELMKPDYLKPQSSIWQLSKNLQQMRNGRIPNIGSHQATMGGDFPKAGDKRSHKLTECDKKKVKNFLKI